MPADDELNIETNPHLGQHFLSNPVKLAQLIEAAGIRPADHVAEAGAGIGAVAEYVPTCQSLTLIEYDVNLIPHLRKRVPCAQIVHGDALAILPTVSCDVLLINLPSGLTSAVVELLPELHFRVALMATDFIGKLALLEREFSLEKVVMLEPQDFRPKQSARAEIVRIQRRQ